MPLPPPLLAALPLLACPRCGGVLAAAADRDDGAECRSCGARWPLAEGVLDCLADEPVEEEPRG